MSSAASNPIIHPTDGVEKPIIDAHQHLWDLRRLNLPWITPGTALARSYLPTDYQIACEDLGILKTVYAEVDCAPASQVAEAEYVLKVIEDPALPTAAAVIGGRPADEGFR